MVGFKFIFEGAERPELGQFPLYKGTEDNLQKQVATYLDFSEAVWFHSPNGGKRNLLEAIKFKKMGVKSGVPDCLILNQRQGFKGLAIELKVGKNQPTQNQMDWLEDLARLGYLCWVSWSLDEVVALIDWYFDKRKPLKLTEKK